MAKPPSNSNNDLGPQIRCMNDYARERLATVMDALETELTTGGRDYTGPCPVHGGDNPTSVHLYEDGHTVKGNWFCATRGCEKHFGRDLFGFVRGVLSHKNKGWLSPDDERVSLGETLSWFASLFEVDPKELLNGAERSDEINMWVHRQSRLATSPPAIKRAGWSRDEVRAKMVIPSPYFLTRGFPAGILDKYDVGEPRMNQGPMAGRAIVPIYDIPGERVIGFTGRRLVDDETSPKWLNSAGFTSGSTLFNFWVARGAIKKTKKVILVEGIGDCLRLVSAGVENVVATFGTKLTDVQQILLESLGTMELMPLFDFDGAGRSAVASLRRQAGRSFRIKVPDWSPVGKDVGGCTEAELHDVLEILS